MRIKGKSGQAMVEFALVLPVLILILCGIIDFGWIFGNQLSADNACREAARVCAVNSQLTESALYAKAEEVFINRAATLYGVSSTFSLVVQRNLTDGSVSVEVDCGLPLLTPVASTILGPTFDINAETVMRME